MLGVRVACMCVCVHMCVFMLGRVCVPFYFFAYSHGHGSYGGLQLQHLYLVLLMVETFFETWVLMYLSSSKPLPMRCSRHKSVVIMRILVQLNLEADLVNDVFVDSKANVSPICRKAKCDQLFIWQGNHCSICRVNVYEF